MTVFSKAIETLFLIPLKELEKFKIRNNKDYHFQISALEIMNNPESFHSFLNRLIKNNFNYTYYELHIEDPTTMKPESCFLKCNKIAMQIENFYNLGFDPYSIVNCNNSVSSINQTPLYENHIPLSLEEYTKRNFILLVVKPLEKVCRKNLLDHRNENNFSSLDSYGLKRSSC